MLNYNKNDVAPFPPMGWNSYDYYNTTVNEAQVRQNAEYMAKNLKKYGWEYVVIDIQWSDPDAGKQNTSGVQYIPFSRFCIDEFSRQIPAENRFPSSAGGLGFKPLADYIHSLGLKFGIHIMRGIPRFAAHEHLPIKTHDGTKITADMVANPYSISRWNPDMYGVKDFSYGQDYYDSCFELYAQWGVDFVKVDDICNTNMYPQNPYSAEKEIEMIANAIENCGRQMVLSLSPGPAVIEKAHHYKNFANMWRITDDFWDDWKLLKAMFERCEVWQSHTGGGNWPDCDMLPMNVLGYGWGDMNNPENKGWKCKFTQEESRTMMTLWSIFRAPLMIGTDLPQLDDFSLSLLTNEEILAMNKNPLQAYQASSSCNENIVIWVNECPDQKSYYECIFNLSDEVQTVKLNLKVGNHDNIRDLWERKDLGNCSEFVLEPHSCKALKISL
ncbi:MAG: glycoside hydrolase family 27 protein [Spirochaetales bacterium]|nr:glycoside hydrolase family 27 protein [Spirochaetales bacterium]MDY5915193.1 glycoside hydrolase family 27 protein [Treponema sp.]